MSAGEFLQCPACARYGGRVVAGYPEHRFRCEHCGHDVPASEVVDDDGRTILTRVQERKDS